MAERQFLLVNPENRLVADSLENRWNETLRNLSAAEEEFNKWKAENKASLSTETREDVLRLVEDFPKVWNHSKTTARDRKQMLRLVIEDITLFRQDDIRISIRWRGGATSELTIPVPPNAHEARRTDERLLERIAELAKCFPDEEIAERMRQEKRHSGTGQALTGQLIARLRRSRQIPGLFEHLRKAGMRTAAEIVKETGIGECTLRNWRKAGLLHALRCDKKHWLYESPSQELLQRAAKKRHNGMFGRAQSKSRRQGAV
jgi:hypothetical protein